MASLEAIRDAIASTLDGLGNLTPYATVRDAANLPAVIAIPTEADFDVAMGRGVDTWTFDLLVLVSIREMRIAQNELDGFVTGAGSNSIRQAIFNNRSLGLSDGTDAHVAGMREYGSQYQLAKVGHVGAKLQLVVHTKGTA
jgi:hypothetical protein